ncbi:hypothetical protein M8C17_01440 [Micromonospora sp. RHAY321]|uniref:hypothetical protein n=1 Tax=unclassified Micromonospora TaxID=2617518 RepID=UPI0013791385|nr:MULTISPECIES: hypothetical protein [unclassified Micromonospora]MCO1593824.1 hypothetical protein [Micromonospora sp. RHAY321]
MTFLVLALALSGALNIALAAGIIAAVAGQSRYRALAVGGTAFLAVLTVFFTALPSYT